MSILGGEWISFLSKSQSELGQHEYRWSMFECFEVFAQEECAMPFVRCGVAVCVKHVWMFWGFHTRRMCDALCETWRGRVRPSFIFTTARQPHTFPLMRVFRRCTSHAPIIQTTILMSFIGLSFTRSHFRHVHKYNTAPIHHGYSRALRGLK